MKIAMDGGAFQQGIVAGITNVSIGLMNAIADIEPKVSFLLISDPRLGEIREDLIDRLKSRPEIISAAVGPAYRSTSLKLTTQDPAISFEVDGVLIRAKSVGDSVIYDGPTPKRSFYIISSSAKPCEVGHGPDGRVLGVSISNIAVRTGSSISVISMDDTRLRDGFYNCEDGARWTNGRASLPLEFFPTSETVELDLRISGALSYQRGFGIFDKPLANLSARAEAADIRINMVRLEEELLEKGVAGYISNHFIPINIPSIKNFAILYDMIPVIYPEYFQEDARENFSYNIDVFRKADNVFSISEASRVDLIRLAGVNPQKVSLMSIDISPVFGPRSHFDVENVKTLYGLTRAPYILTVGTLEPRKNHRRTIETFSKICEANVANCDLVIVGNRGWDVDDLLRDASPRTRSKIHLLHSVPNEDLSAIYSGALFLAYPSLYEGFGLPILEAMACGCPVLTSITSSMPEVAGQAALFVDPEDGSSLLKGFQELIRNAALRERLVAEGFKRRHSFSWKLSAHRVLNILHRD